mgnify:CR=1 FL=1
MARIVLNERPTGCWDCPFYALFDCRYYRDDQIFPGYCEYITTPDELKEENKYMEKAIHDGCTAILKNGKTHV